MAWSRLDLGVGVIATEGVQLLRPAIADLVARDRSRTADPLGPHRRRRAAHQSGRARLVALAPPAAVEPTASAFRVGGTVAPEIAGVRASARSAVELDAQHWSEHLSVNRAGSGAVKHAGYLLPPIPVAQTAAAAVRHISRFQEQFDRPFLVETPTSYPAPPTET
jgi:hypothetical protein